MDRTPELERYIELGTKRVACGGLEGAELEEFFALERTLDKPTRVEAIREFVDAGFPVWLASCHAKTVN